ncbi:MAG TPA: DUF120 domain-containing protein [Candidatus Altiarchaeales archaeon]|nr:DUF120 domain-containing protein [Candidatus Altiarchaeales archaeon]
MDLLKHALVELANLCSARASPFIIASGEYGRHLEVSQQSASRYLTQLEERGYIKRTIRGRGQEISFTEAGLNVIKTYKDNITNFLSEGRKKRVEGVLTSGLGEGAYYVKEYSEKLEDIVGFKPYAGTFNLLVTELPQVAKNLRKRISGFERDGRSFGYLDLVEAELNVGGVKETCFLIIPERHHHKNQIEMISRYNLRKKYGLKDGDKGVLSF